MIIAFREFAAQRTEPHPPRLWNLKRNKQTNKQTKPNFFWSTSTSRGKRQFNSLHCNFSDYYSFKIKYSVPRTDWLKSYGQFFINNRHSWLSGDKIAEFLTQTERKRWKNVQNILRMDVIYFLRSMCKKKTSVYTLKPCRGIGHKNWVWCKGLCTSRRLLSTSADNVLLDLHNSLHHTQPHSINMIGRYFVLHLTVFTWSYALSFVLFRSYQNTYEVIINVPKKRQVS